MTMNWDQEKYDCSTQAERDAERDLRIQPGSLVPRTPPQFDHPLTDLVEAESILAVGDNQWKIWFIGWDVLFAAVAVIVIFFCLNVASFGVLGSALTAAGIVAALALAHYLLWGRAFARGVERETREVQDQARRLGTSETDPPDEFLLGLNNRERMELLRLLEHSMGARTQGREGSQDSAVIRRELHARIRMFGA
jgi:hypothetical protein